MQTLDYIIIIACISAAIGGFRLGFVARVASWLGMAVGFALALVILPHVLGNGGGLASTSRLSFVILLLLAGLLLGQMFGLLAGSRLASVLPPGPLRVADRLVGSLAGVVGVFVVLWLLIPTAANVPGWAAQQVHGSQLAQAIANDAPIPPNFSKTITKLVGGSQFPSVFSELAPSLDAGPAPTTVQMPAGVVTKVEQASVKVEGEACHRTQDGSGWAVAQGLIMTNAHVVAGEKSTNVINADGKVLEAQVVYYDPQRDIAMLQVPRFNGPVLSVGTSKVDTSGAVFGHPGGQAAIAIQPAVVRRQVVAVGRDLYDSVDTKRDVLILASSLAPGDSGGALVDDNGVIQGMAFAIAPDQPGTSYALSTKEINEALALPHNQLASTQSCLND